MGEVAFLYYTSLYYTFLYSWNMGAAFIRIITWLSLKIMNMGLIFRNYNANPTFKNCCTWGMRD